MKSFAEIAAQKAKPGADIVAQMTPEKAHLLHMAVGIAGEAGELLAAVQANDRGNIIEEIGDMRFYMAGIQNGLGWPDHEIAARPASDLHDSADETVLLAAAILDEVKRHCIYNKDLDLAELHITMESLRGRLARMVAAIGVTPADVLAANVAKLNRRYAGGYSDVEAQARKDKAS